MSKFKTARANTHFEKQRLEAFEKFEQLPKAKTKYYFVCFDEI